MSVLDTIKARQLAAQNNMATGPATSLNVGVGGAPDASAKPQEQPEISMEAPEGGYKALRLKQFFLSSGKKVSPVNGYYVPNSQEEEDMLKDYVMRGDGMLVEAPKEE